VAQGPVIFGAIQGSRISIKIRDFGRAGSGAKNNSRLDFGIDPDYNPDSGFRYLDLYQDPVLQELLKDSLFTIAVPVDSLE